MNHPLRELLDRAWERLRFACADAEGEKRFAGSVTEEAFHLLTEALALVSAAGMAGAAQKNNSIKSLNLATIDVLTDPSVKSHAHFQRTLFTSYRDLFAQLFPIQGSSRDLISLYLRKYLQILESTVDLAALQPSARRGPVAELALAEGLTFFLNHWTGSLTIFRPSSRTLEGPEVQVLPGSSGSAANLKSLSRQIREGLYLVSETVPPLSLHPFFFLEEDKPYLLRLLTTDGGFYRELGKGGYSLLLSTSLMMDLGEWLFRCGAYSKAIGLFRLASDKNREASIFISTLSHCLNAQDFSSKGELLRAIGEWELALTVKGEYPVLYHELANEYVAASRPQQAISILNRLLERFPVSDEGYVSLGDIYAAKGDWGRAQRAYEKAIALNPHHEEATEKRHSAREHLENKHALPETADKTHLPMEELLSPLTAQVLGRAREPITGRANELAQLLETLSCRDKRCVLIVGESGVGKTALVEELAVKLQGEGVPASLKSKKISALNLSTLISGARFRGQFEERVLLMLKQIRERGEIVLIENLHLLISTGSSKGASLDSAALLKPALTRGEIQIIGTTDEDSLSNILEKEPSFLKQFHVLRLEELSISKVQEILRLRRPAYEAFHGVTLPGDLFESNLDLVRMSISDKKLPESALDLMDRTAARVSLRRGATSPSPEVTREDMLITLSEMSGVSFERLSMLNRDRLSGLEELLSARVVGQEEAVSSVSRVVRVAKMGLDLNPRRPDGVFLFVGPTGVGKTEMARRLAEILFGDEEKLIRIDMSEYMERISTSRLIGTAPGYVGYNDTTQLTDRVRRNPYCVILFDEVEKADPQVLNLFLQIFDAGRLTDGKGRTVRFHHATIIMTCNVGGQLYRREKLGYKDAGGERVDVEGVLREVRNSFSPEFLNRVDEVVLFAPLTQECMGRIVDLQLQELRERLAHQGKCLILHESARQWLALQVFSEEYGAREVGRILRKEISEPMAELALGEEWEKATAIQITLSDGHIRHELIRPSFDFSLSEGRKEESEEQNGQSPRHK